MGNILKKYVETSLVLRIIVAFVAGAVAGLCLWFASDMTGRDISGMASAYISPFGMILIAMLKMVVIPVIFFSLITGAASLPLKRSGRIGTKVIIWYIFTSLLAAVLGTAVALIVNPGKGIELGLWQKAAKSFGGKVTELSVAAPATTNLTSQFMRLFTNPFEALAHGDFLGIIVFAILFGLAMRVTIESKHGSETAHSLQQVIKVLGHVRDVIFKLVDWVLEYSPIGVLALSAVNFSLYGPEIVGPYAKLILAVIVGILLLVFGGYSVLLFIFTRENPFRIMNRLKEAIITAFITRSSAATLPVSLRVVDEELKVKDELSSFSLSLGATINMDGVCIHLPMFAVLAANWFGLELTMTNLVILVVTTVLASVGAGGVPGGSVMLLFIILESMGLDAHQVAVIVALAMGVNPVLDMFETANNVAGDLICTYTVAKREGLIRKDEDQPG